MRSRWLNAYLSFYISTLGGRKFVVNANYLTWKIEKEENYHNPTTLLQPQLIFGCISPVLLFFLHGVIVVIHGHYCTYRFLPFLMCYYSSFMKLTIYISVSPTRQLHYLYGLLIWW